MTDALITIAPELEALRAALTENGHPLPPDAMTTVRVHDLATVLEAVQALSVALHPDPAGFFFGQSGGQIIEHIRGRYTVSRAAADVFFERKRQVIDEGWTPEHDDEHSNEELAKAASSYAWPVYLSNSPVVRDDMPLQFPDEWDLDWWKPSDRRRDLVKAGALIIAEIERLDRAAGPQR